MCPVSLMLRNKVVIYDNLSHPFVRPDIAISTKESPGWSILGNNLYYIHLMLLCKSDMQSLLVDVFVLMLILVLLLFPDMVTYLNMFRNYCNWKGFGAYATSMKCVVFGTIFLVFPMQYVVHWAARAFVWIFLGPLMKLVDIRYVHPSYRTREELEADPEFHGTNLESVLTSEALQKMIRRGRLAGEEAMKLKDMREHRFGKFSFQVPAVDTQRKPNIPLPSSSAQPYLGTAGDPSKGFVDVDKSTWVPLPGQNLTGTMVHHLAMSSENLVALSEEVQSEEALKEKKDA